MLNKDLDFKWKVQARYAFTQIKKAIYEASILANSDYTKPFNIFSFASNTTLAIV